MKEKKRCGDNSPEANKLENSVLEKKGFFYYNVDTSLIGNYQAPDLFGCLGSFFYGVNVTTPFSTACP
jgi:hypothetical protein